MTEQELKDLSTRLEETLEDEEFAGFIQGLVARRMEKAKDGYVLRNMVLDAVEYL